jgi:hypothetical protein
VGGGMKVNFRLYCGLAGDLQQLLIAETEDDNQEHMLISRVGLFRKLFLNRAKRKLIKRLELKTGKKYTE